MVIYSVAEDGLAFNMKIIKDSPSQASQDSFAMNMLDWKRNGYYVEIGAYDPYKLSNTYSLEKDYGWSGISFDIKKIDFSSRKNVCLQLDATLANYEEIFKQHKTPEIVDYLQLDIDPAPRTLSALKLIPFDRYKFSVITFEHDSYRGHESVAVESRKILQNKGYKLLIKNVGNPDPYEDWYIHPELITKSIWERYEGIQDIEWQSLYE